MISSRSEISKILVCSRHYQSVHRFLEGGNPERALSLGMTTDTETSDDALRLMDRVRQIARCPPVSCILIYFVAYLGA